jgi:hypothetical protein
MMQFDFKNMSKIFVENIRAAAIIFALYENGWIYLWV